MTNEEYDYMMEEKETRRLDKLYRKGSHRFIKNLLIWFVGVLFGLTLTVGTVCAGIFLIPLGNYANIAGNATGLDSSEYISDEMGKGSLYHVIKNIGEFSFGDVPVLGNAIEKAITESEYRDIVKFDKQKFNGMKIGGFGKDGNTKEMTSCVEVKASVKDLEKLLGFTLGAIEELSAFKEYQPVEEADKPSPVAEGETLNFNVHNYYYLKSEGEYKRAFDDDGNYVEGVTNETALYYPAFMDVSILEIPHIYADSFARGKIKEIIKALNANFDENSVIGKIVKEKTIKEFTNISIDEILVSDVLDLTDKTSSIYKMVDMLCDGITPSEGEEKPTVETMTLGDLSKADFNAVKLNKVLGSVDESTWKIIENGTGKTRDEVTVGDLSSLKTDNMKLIDVLKDETDGEKKLWTVLLSGLDKTEADKNDVKISDLSSFDVNKVKLTAVLDKTVDNAKLWTILKDVTGSIDEESITLGSLSSFDVNAIKLTSVLDKNADNEKLWTILKDVTGSIDEESITLGSLSSFDVNAIKLTSVLDRTAENEKLWTILIETTGKTDASQIVLGDLNDFSTDNVRLVSVMEMDKADKFWDVIIEGSGRTWTTETRDEKIDSLTMKDMTSFDMDRVRLGTLIEPTGNNVVDKLIEKNVKLGEISTVISNLTLYEVYGEQCFTTDSANAKDATVKYLKTTDASGNAVYVKSDDGTYYVSKESGMWLIICYQGNGALNDDGKSTTFVARDFTIQQLQSDSETVGEQALHFATMADLMDSGIVPAVTMYARVAKMTFAEFIAEAVLRMNAG